MISDRAGWLEVAKDTGLITVRSPMDRESPFVKDDKYTALIGAYDDGKFAGETLVPPGCLERFLVKDVCQHLRML